MWFAVTSVTFAFHVVNGQLCVFSQLGGNPHEVTHHDIGNSLIGSDGGYVWLSWQSKSDAGC